MTTFEFQKDLPSLPIPELGDTKRKLLEAIKPLVDQEEFQQTKREIQQFFEDTGEAQKLQEKLLEWKDGIEGNWLKPFWDDVYLMSRAPLHTSSNFNILTDNQHYQLRTIAELAAKVSRATAEFYHLISEEKAVPEMARDIPLDMSQYPNFFRSARIPKSNRDEHYVAEFTKLNNHISLLTDGHMYSVPVTDQEGNIYSSDALAQVIDTILSTEQSPGPNVGIFTTVGREEAAEIYHQLSTSPVNAAILQSIANSLVVISIDKESGDSDETVKNLTFNGRDKYFDKTLQLVITQAGELGYSVEHSAVDGTTSFAVIQYIQDQLSTEESETIQTNELPVTKLHVWELSPEQQDILAELERRNAETIQDYFINIQNFETFGTDEMKRLRFSPDSFFHMALQVAQYKTFSTMRSTYEAVSMRLFNEGRTECLRPSSLENLTLAKALVDEKQNTDWIYSLMQNAGSAHSVRLKESQRGFGMERHMYGLQKIYEMYGADSGVKQLSGIFTDPDPGYKTLRHDFISTSNMTHPAVKSCAFGPVVEDGYGIFYVLLKDRLLINLSSYSGDEANAKLLAENLKDALNELRNIASNAM